ncbi:MAG: nitroreductase family protein [Carboxydocellales bacterium]
MNKELLQKILKQRRSIRRWKQTEIPRWVIEEAVSMAMLAPNGGNAQNWYFIAVLNKKVIQEIAEIVLTKALAITEAGNNTTWQQKLAAWAKNTVLFRTAPALITVYQSSYQNIADRFISQIGIEEKSPLLRDVEQNRAGINSGLQSVSAAVSYLLLALSEAGLGAVWMTSPLIAKKELEELLPSPPGTNLVSLIALGYPEESPENRPRKSLSEVIKFIE